MAQFSLADYDASLPPPQLIFARIQSPSSINLYKQCPRKYYYQYIEKIPTGVNIHQVRGNIVHSALEDYYKVDIAHISALSYEVELNILLLDLLKTNWFKKKDDLTKTGFSYTELMDVYHETEDMMAAWHKKFFSFLAEHMKSTDSLVASFRALTPITERQFTSPTWGVRGFIDAIYKNGEDVTIIDYKTSSKPGISDEYKLQLAIYALMFHETEKILPKYVGIDFLRFGREIMPVDYGLLEMAKSEVVAVHKLTQSTAKKDYPKNPGPLCKWRTGQCDFYDTCFVRDKSD